MCDVEITVIFSGDLIVISLLRFFRISPVYRLVEGDFDKRGGGGPGMNWEFGSDCTTKTPLKPRFWWGFGGGIDIGG